MKIQKETIAITTLLGTGALSLPVLTSGFLAGKFLGMAGAIILILLSALIISTLAGISAYTGSTFASNTIVLARKHFGTSGIIMISLALAIALTGWFAIQTLFICDAARTLVPEFSSPLCILTIGISLTLLRMVGLTHLGTIATIMAIPLGIIISLVILYIPTQTTIIYPTISNGMLVVGGLLGTTITATLELPILYKSIKEPRQALLSSITVFGLIIPIIQIIGAYLGTQSSPETNLISTLVTSIPKGDLMVAILIICSGIIANLLNLYSSSESLKSIAPKLSNKKSILLAGGTGTLLALLPITNNILAFFSLLTVSAGSLSLIMIHTYVMKLKKQSRNILTPIQALVIWLSATTIGSISQFFASTYPIVNPLITTLLMTGALIMLQPKSPITLRNII